MNKPIRFLLLAAVMAMCLGAPSVASAQTPWPPFCQEGSLPSHDTQYPADQLILTCIPPGWNGSLVMYAHGYVPEPLPLALPYEELSQSGGMLTDPAPLVVIFGTRGGSLAENSASQK